MHSTAPTSIQVACARPTIHKNPMFAIASPRSPWANFVCTGTISHHYTYPCPTMTKKWYRCFFGMALMSVQRTSATAVFLQLTTKVASRFTHFCRWGGTALHAAALENRISLADLLLKHFSDVNAVTDRCLFSCLFSCIRILS